MLRVVPCAVAVSVGVGVGVGVTAVGGIGAGACPGHPGVAVGSAIPDASPRASCGTLGATRALFAGEN